MYTDDDRATGNITVPSEETEEPATEADPAEPATDDPNQTATDSQTEDDGQTEDGTPGFGPLVGIVALLTIALLAIAVSRARGRN